MINNIIEELKGKKIIILGMGLEGVSTYNLLTKYSKELNIYLYDDNNVDKIVVDKGINIDKNKLVTKSNYIDLLKEYDVIIKTPGMSFKGLDVSDYKHKITSQVELFLKYNDCLTIGITGSKGKSTTTSLLYEVLNNELDNVIIAGNIGIPIFDQIENINKDSIVVLELSCQQLQFVTNSPTLAVILNFYEEHLDHYDSYNDYKNGKLNIVSNNNKTKYFIFDKSIEDICNTKSISNKVVVDYNDKTNIYNYDFTSKPNLLGEHNKKNILFVLRVLETLKFNNLKQVSNSINNFKPLEHRIEPVGTFNGVTFYNDSISTIPEAVISCVEAIPNLDTLIIGGLDRGVNYEAMVEYINNSNLNNIICLRETGHKLAPKIVKQTHLVETLEEAIQVVYSIDSKVCALSPGAASYNSFKNFIERGNKYKELIKKYSRR